MLVKEKPLFIVKSMKVDEDKLWSIGSILKIKWKPLGILVVKDSPKKINLKGIVVFGCVIKELIFLCWKPQVEYVII